MFDRLIAFSKTKPWNIHRIQKATRILRAENIGYSYIKVEVKDYERN